MKTKNDFITLATQRGSTCTTFAGARRWLLTHPATVVPLVGLVTDLPRRAEQSIRYAADMARYRMMSDLVRTYTLDDEAEAILDIDCARQGISWLSPICEVDGRPLDIVPIATAGNKRRLLGKSRIIKS